jgi:hypothetical protein
MLFHGVKVAMINIVYVTLSKVYMKLDKFHVTLSKVHMKLVILKRDMVV